MEFEMNGSKWLVAFVEPMNRMLQRSDGTVTVGVTDKDSMCIYLSSALRGAFLERVLCHELCHCICFSYDIYMPIETEERLCNFMADYGKEIIYILDDLLSMIMVKSA